MKLTHRFAAPARCMKAALAALALLGAATETEAALLYDASHNELPSAQGWSFAATGGSFLANGGIYVLNTSPSNGFQAGNVRTLAAGQLDTVSGFDLGIGLNVVAESHANANRAGFSLLFMGDDQSRALELGFWMNDVWAYTPTFTHGTSSNADTAGFHDYLLRVRNNHYSLERDHVQILSGALVDYQADSGNPLTAIYDQPRTIFFGDDTTSAGANVNVKYVSLTAAPVPLPGALVCCLPAVLALGALRRRR